MKRSGVLITVFLALVLLIGAASGYAFFDPNTVSEEENRTLAKRPELSSDTWFSGGFASGLEAFLSDHVYGRGPLVGVAQRLEEIMGRQGEIMLVTHDASEMGDDSNTKPQDVGESEGGEGGVMEMGATDTGESTKQDRLVLEDRILSVYGFASDNLIYYTKVANEFFNMFPDYINKYCLVAPSRIAFETEELAQYSDDQNDAIQYIYDNLEPLIEKVDVYPTLRDNSERLDDIYYRTDHHWTHLGAYYAYRAMGEIAGFEPAPIESYTRSEGSAFLGFYYAQDRYSSLEKHMDELIYYTPRDHAVPTETLYVSNEDGIIKPEEAVTLNPMRAGYYTFVGRTFAYAVMDGANKDGGCILVVADSYGNALCTWLAESYSCVIEIDPREYRMGREGVLALVEEYGVTEVLLCDYINSVDSTYFSSQLNDITE